MQVLINTDHNINGHVPLITHVSGIVEHALLRFREHITRVEVHLSDQNRHKSGVHGQRCMIEVHIRGRRLVAAMHESESLDQAVAAATHKLVRLIGDVLGRQRDHPSSDAVEPPVA